MKVDICVIGAGIIGIATALELQERGVEVLLVDRGDPGMQTSFGNAGVLSVSTVLNVNNPGLFRAAPKLLARAVPYFDYDLSYALSRLGWLGAFFRHALPRYSLPIAHALQGLQRVSIDRHRQLIARAGVDSEFSERGWLKVYRDAKAYRASVRERELMRQLGVDFRELSSAEVRSLEPALIQRYENGLLLTESCSVSDPYTLTRAYLGLFEKEGGRLHRMDVVGLEEGSDWRIHGRDGSALSADKVVIACGPWAPDLCDKIGYRVPMAWERGYHVQLKSPQPALQRPVLDTQHGFVMAPQGELTRISSGVEFTHRDAPPNYRQVERAVLAARESAAFGAQADGDPWMGSRPTLPDGLPVIGRAARHSKLWFNFGHQHNGMSTSTGSAIVLADLLTGHPGSELDVTVYAPARFGL